MRSTSRLRVYYINKKKQQSETLITFQKLCSNEKETDFPASSESPYLQPRAPTETEVSHRIFFEGNRRGLLPLEVSHRIAVPLQGDFFS